METLTDDEQLIINLAGIGDPLPGVKWLMERERRETFRLVAAGYIQPTGRDRLYDAAEMVAGASEPLLIPEWEHILTEKGKGAVRLPGESNAPFLPAEGVPVESYLPA